jgi:hypothetical protein
MKNFFFLILLFKSLFCFAQQETISNEVLKASEVVFFGIDFSHTLITGESLKHKQILQDSLLQEMNLYFLSREMGWLKNKLSKTVIAEEEVIRSQNRHYTDAVLNGDADSVQEILRTYHAKINEGTGLVFLVKYLDKPGKTVEIFAVFFDISTRKLIWKDYEKGEAWGGPPGLMNFWYPKMNNAIRKCMDACQFQEVTKKGRFKPNQCFLKIFPDEAAIGYERNVNPDLNISFEVGYRFAWSNTWHYTGQVIPVEYLGRFACFHGYTFRADFKFKVSRRSEFGPVFGYQHISCPEVIWDPGQFGGVDDAEYSVWSQYNDELVMQLVDFVNLGEAPYPVQFFIGAGLKICMVSEHYSINGYKASWMHFPSDMVVNETKIQPLVTFGLSIKLGSW